MRIRSVILILLLGLLTFFLWRLYREQCMMLDLLEQYRKKAEAPRVVERVVEHGKVSTWSDVQTKIRDTVVQIFNQGAEFNWLEPYKTPSQFQVSGSGFFINEEGDIITNAHVVDQAKAVSVQLPSFGKQRFDVDVIGISPDRDLAVLRLRPEDRKTIVTALGALPTISLADSDYVHRADEIMAIGYPLGQQSLKSTTGVVSGREHINGQHMIQISAPINPGSSGGPSINSSGAVIGVNSAGVSAAQNVGYIIPSNEVTLFLRQLEQIPATNNIKLLRKPMLGILYNIGTEALTSYLNNPQPGGLYVVDTVKGSLLEKAGVRPSDMVFEIDGQRLDIFGEMNVPWSEDKISIVDYASRLTFGDEIHLLMYRRGVRKDVRLIYQPGELLPIRRMHPQCEKIDYEVIGGMVVMELTINHLPILVNAAPELARYAEFKHQMEPVLVITHVLPDSQAMRSRAIGIGAIISEINDQPVKTLTDFRNALKKSIKTNFLMLRTSENIFTVLPFNKIVQEEPRLAQNYFYPLSPFMRELIKKPS